MQGLSEDVVRRLKIKFIIFKEAVHQRSASLIMEKENELSLWR